MYVKYTTSGYIDTGDHFLFLNKYNIFVFNYSLIPGYNTVTLFHLGLKEECKKNKIAFAKSATKDDLYDVFGKYLFQSKIFFRIDDEKGVSFDNLKSF